MRHRLAVALGLALLAGCEGSTWEFQPLSRNPAASSRPTAKPATRPAPPPAVMATVAGQPIPMSELVDLLVRAHGVDMAYQLVANELVRQAAGAKGLTAGDKEVQEESDRTLAEMFPQADRADQRERLLEQLLQQRGVSYKQWRMIMLRNVLLRKLVEPRVTVQEKDIVDEFGLQYGRQVQVRHIQTESLASAQEVLTKLEEGADFAELATEMSVNPTTRADGGLMPPIGKDSRMVPPAIREAALAMKTVGEITDPIQVETAFHILRLEKIIEPQDVKFTDVKDQLATSVRNRRLRAEQTKLLQQLIQDAQDAKKIQYVDPVLKAQVQAAQEQRSQR